ncbi:hypothetical protein [Streptomyces sp. MAR4 CNX-425]|uniref:hypothetical protein n=1 Tax=Streptomyces sp. MAR4 CNX-425 TaxID=3406343 RepID=UPI003B513543
MALTAPAGSTAVFRRIARGPSLLLTGAVLAAVAAVALLCGAGTAAASGSVVKTERHVLPTAAATAVPAAADGHTVTWAVCDECRPDGGGVRHCERTAVTVMPGTAHRVDPPLTAAPGPGRAPAATPHPPMPPPPAPAAPDPPDLHRLQRLLV